MSAPLPVIVHRPRRGVGEYVAATVGTYAAIFMSSWLLMLTLGALHHNELPIVPALGYWQTWLVLFGVRCITPGFTAGWRLFADPIGKEGKR